MLDTPILLANVQYNFELAKPLYDSTGFSLANCIKTRFSKCSRRLFYIDDVEVELRATTLNIVDVNHRNFMVLAFVDNKNDEYSIRSNENNVKQLLNNIKDCIEQFNNIDDLIKVPSKNFDNAEYMEEDNRWHDKESSSVIETINLEFMFDSATSYYNFFL